MEFIYNYVWAHEVVGSIHRAQTHTHNSRTAVRAPTRTSPELRPTGHTIRPDAPQRSSLDSPRRLVDKTNATLAVRRFCGAPHFECVMNVNLMSPSATVVSSSSSSSSARTRTPHHSGVRVHLMRWRLYVCMCVPNAVTRTVCLVYELALCLCSECTCPKCGCLISDLVRSRHGAKQTLV